MIHLFNQDLRFRHVYSFLKEIELYKKCIEHIVIKNIKYDGEYRPRIQYFLVLKKGIKDKTKEILKEHNIVLRGYCWHIPNDMPNRIKYALKRHIKITDIERIHPINCYELRDTIQIMIYLYMTIIQFFNHDPIKVKIIFNGDVYLDDTEQDYNDFIIMSNGLLKDLYNKIVHEPTNRYYFTKYLSDKLNESRSILEIISILKQERCLPFFRNNNIYDLDLHEQLRETKTRLEKIEKLINSRKNSYIMSKLKSGDLHAKDVQQYPELIEAVDELTKLKTMVGMK